MSTRLIPQALAAAMLAGGGCYQDDTAPSAPQSVKLLTRVLLTDAPFPYDSVASVNLHVVRIEASNQPDTSGGGNWVLVTEPRKAFDLLELQQGTTTIVGEGELPAGQYRAIRMTIDTGLSSIIWSGGAQRVVNWQTYSQPYAFVESPGDVSLQGAGNVIRFDLGRSLP